MARRKYTKLKSRMYEMDIRQIDLVPVVGRKIAYISVRMSGKAPWNTAEMKAIGEYLGIPRDQWLDYFIDDEEPQIDRAIQIRNLQRLRMDDQSTPKAS